VYAFTSVGDVARFSFIPLSVAGFIWGFAFFPKSGSDDIKAKMTMEAAAAGRKLLNK
jgi:hypothetical protein